MILFKKGYRLAKQVFSKSKEHEIYLAAGHSSLFIVISFFPLILLLLSLLKYTPLTAENMTDFIKFISLPTQFEDALKEALDTKTSTALSISAISLIWSASASIFSIMRGLNHVYEKKETRNYFIIRASAILYTLLFIISLVVALGLLVFGGTLYDTLSSILPLLESSEFFSMLLGKSVAFLMLVILFDLLYTLIPNRPSLPHFEIFGALFAGVGWYIFSYFYSLYVENFSRLPSIYGSIAAIVLLLVWLYICMYIFFLGAELNIVLDENGLFKTQRETFYEKRKAKEKQK